MAAPDRANPSSLVTSDPDMTSPNKPPVHTTPAFRTTLIRVMAVQLGALLLLWLLQSHYTG
jgi:hypothetical protein